LKFLVKSGEFDSEININGTAVSVGEEPVEIEFGFQSAREHFSLLKDGRSYEVQIEKGSEGYDVFINGSKYNVQITDEKEQLLRRFVRSEQAELKHVEIKAPMPGLVVEFKVNETQSVAKGEIVVVIEAMKMANEICAPIAGKVTKIFYNAGDSVTAGAVLLKIE